MYCGVIKVSNQSESQVIILGIDASVKNGLEAVKTDYSEPNYESMSVVQATDD